MAGLQESARNLGPWLQGTAWQIIDAAAAFAVEVVVVALACHLIARRLARHIYR